MDTSVEARARLAFAATLLALAAGALGWYLISAARHASYEVRTQDAVSGLVPGAPVEFHGVEIGKVDAVRLAGPRSVRIRISVRRDAPVSSATVATVTSRGLASRGFTGYVYVSLEDRAGPARPLAPAAGEDVAVITAAPSTSVNLDTAIDQMNRNVQGVTATLQAALDPATVTALKQSLAGLQQVTRTLAANNDRLVAILANAERASGQLPPLLQASRASVDTLRTQVLPQAQAAMRELDQLSASANGRLGTILRNTEQASTHFEPLLESSSDALLSLRTQILPEAHRTLTRLDHLSLTLDETVTRIRRNPSVLLRGFPDPVAGPGESR